MAYIKFCYNKFCIEILFEVAIKAYNLHFAITNFVLKFDIGPHTITACYYFAITNFVLKYKNTS